MDKYRRLAELLNNQFGNKQMPLFNAVVKSIQEDSCTVDFDGLEIDEVRLKAAINDNENKLIIEPAIDSIVLIGSLTNDLKDLAVLRVDEVSRVIYKQDGLDILIDSTDKKISVANETVSVYGLFQSLVDLLKQFKVYTPAGPSGTPLPDTIAAITAFENAFKTILK